jgi:hypothetical protein
VSSESLIGEGELSNPLLIWAVDLPAATTLTLTDTSRSSCSVQWSAVAPPANTLITGYQVLIDDGLGGDFSVAYDGKTNPSLLSAVIDGLESRTTYRMQVRAFNKAGSGANSTVLTCYTVTIPGQPGKP